MQTKLASDTIDKICRISPIISSPRFSDPALATPLAVALTRGRLPVIEISIRDRNAAAIIAEIAQVPDAIVGAGTVLSAEDVARAREAGAQFCSTPGVTDPLLRFFDGIDMPMMPGAATPSEAMYLVSRGYTTLNFYPGGSDEAPHMLRAIHRPMPQIRFCVGGDITGDQARRYLELPNVVSIASDCACPPELIAQKDWSTITEEARKFARRKGM